MNLSKNFEISTSGYNPIDGIKWFEFKKLKPQSLFYPIQFFTTLFRKKKEMDIVIFSYAESKSLVWFLLAVTCVILNKPYVIITHWGIKPKWKFIYPYMYFFNHSILNIGISEQICEDYSNITNCKFKFLPPLIPIEICNQTKENLKISYGLNRLDKVILFVGSLKEMKHPDKILNMFLSNKDYFQENNCVLFFAGDGHLRSAMIEKVKNNGMEDRVFLNGIVLKEKINEVYKMADIYVIASDYEGTPLSMLEAMANRLPIIASDVSGIRNILVNNKTGLLFQLNNETEMFYCLKKLIVNSQFADYVGEQGYKEYNSKYKYSALLDEYVTLFNNLI